MLSLPPNLTLREARAALIALEPGIASTDTPLVTIDASALQRIDSAVLAVLLECRRMAEARQKQIKVVNPPSRLSELAKLYGVVELLSMDGAESTAG
jgi:phospholipid transport system transporter-binding protein